MPVNLVFEKIFLADNEKKYKLVPKSGKVCLFLKAKKKRGKGRINFIL